MHRWMLIGLMTVATAANAQQLDLRSLDKFASQAKGVTQINLDESMIKSGSGLLSDKKGDEATAKKGVAGLKGFYLRVFEFDKKGAYKLDDLKPIRDQIKGPEWTVFLQSREPEEIVVINAIGTGNPTDLGKIGSQLGVPLDGLPGTGK